MFEGIVAHFDSPGTVTKQRTIQPRRDGTLGGTVDGFNNLLFARTQPHVYVIIRVVICRGVSLKASVIVAN